MLISERNTDSKFWPKLNKIKVQQNAVHAEDPLSFDLKNSKILLIFIRSCQ
jgi:hypothetical protein